MQQNHPVGLSRRLSCNCFVVSFVSQLTLFQVRSVLLQVRASVQFLFLFYLYPKVVVLNLKWSFQSRVRCHPTRVTLKNAMRYAM
jgi:hypothetical protein